MENRFLSMMTFYYGILYFVTCKIFHNTFQCKVIQGLILACIQEVSRLYLTDYTDWFSSLPPGKSQDCVSNYIITIQILPNSLSRNQSILFKLELLAVSLN
jgi:hypothetical protein